MSKVLDFVKEKSYILLLGTVLLIIILIIVTSCSGNKMGSYESIESSMVDAARDYYSSKEHLLPKEDGNTVKVSISTLVDLELLDEVIDPNNKEQACTGYVEVTKLEGEYAYVPFLTCPGNYEPKYLTDLVKESSLDEYGNGVYNINGEYIYRGDDVNNYVKFADHNWRILRVNAQNEIKLILVDNTKEKYIWDSTYNIVENKYDGVTTDYFYTNMRKVLVNFYNTKFSSYAKANIVKKDWCMGSLDLYEDFNSVKECSKIIEQEYVGLMNISDYGVATLDVNCTKPNQPQCTNRNYMVSAGISTWTMNLVEGSTSRVHVYTHGSIYTKKAADDYKINPVIYLSPKTIAEGNGTYEEPFIIK